MRIQAKLQCMADNEIAAIIGPERIREIKKEDPQPLFKAFVVGHEGEAKGNLVGVGNVIKRWYQSMIKKLFAKVNVGLELFNGHASDTNNHEGRTSIGRVVAKKLINDFRGLSVVAVCYIYPNFRHLPLDVASIEADVEMEYEPGANLFVTDVNDVTGIALASSKMETPGFPGATLLGQLQAFATKSHYKENCMTPTAEEIRSMIREAELQPSDVFGPKELTADPFVSERMKEKIASPESFYELRKLNKTLAETERRLADLDKEKKTLEEKVKTQDATITKSTLENAKSRAVPLFEKAKTDRKLDDRQVKFVQARLARFSPTKPEDVEKEFNTYLDAEIDECGRLAKDVFGIEDKTVDGKKPGAEPHEPLPDATDSKYLDPAKNPMIKI